jgi:hypothetical protein
MIVLGPLGKKLFEGITLNGTHNGAGMVRPSPPFGARLGDLHEIGEFVPLHQHNFTHLTFCLRGRIYVASAEVIARDAAGQPIAFRALQEGVIRAGDRWPAATILTDTWHVLVALEKGSRYACVFVDRDPDGKPSGDVWDGHPASFE